MIERLTKYSMDHPKLVLGLIAIITIIFALQIPRVATDTDPENMLESNQPDRVFYDQAKNEFGISDLIVVGIVDAEGIFQPESLERIAQATSEILKIKGIIIEDVVSLTTTDNVKSTGGLLDIHPVMSDVPDTPEAVDQLRRDIAENPFLRDKIASEDGTAVALYIPIQQKNESYRIAGEIETILDRTLLPGQQYHLAGLPVAEDTFGHEMFIQMAIVAPIAFIAILLIVFALFRRTSSLLPVGLHAMLSVIWTMGLLIGTGNKVHIMSSMIPVFLMPIAIVDDIHIFSAFFDKCRLVRDRHRALMEAMQPLYYPMLFTSITSAVAFSSMVLAPIPPVRVFGLYVAFGIMVAWLFNHTMVPAVIGLMNERALAKGMSEGQCDESPLLDRWLRFVGRFSYSRASAVLIIALVVLSIGIVGIARLRINDNPVRWFKPGHPMRVADAVMNREFGGTYMAYLVVEGNGLETIKDPDVVRYIDSLQAYLEQDPVVGKTSSVADIVKRINFVLHDNDLQYNAVPDSREAVGQFLFLFQSSGDPNDLDNFLNLEASQANIWVQMKGGDNQQMRHVEDRLASYMRENPLPDGISLRWTGLTYINRIWQNLMVSGMLKAELGSGIVVFFLMWIGFRSLSIAVLSMIPLSIANVFSYGLAGWVGKDYDMPIAVCASLALGMSVDFAIHFLQRSRAHYAESGDPEETNTFMFDEPGRAILRNAIVISLGFLPLVASTLTPYVTVGVFFALCMIASAVSTLFILPAALRFIGPRIFRGGNK